VCGKHITDIMKRTRHTPEEIIKKLREAVVQLEDKFQVSMPCGFLRSAPSAARHC
jgi:hypothetical protein